MQRLGKFAASLIVIFCMATLTYGADVTGTVKGPDGAPFEGAFVQARNTTTRITVSVLSRRGGQYRIPNLPAGEYELRIRAVGYQAQPRTGVNLLTPDQSVSFEFVLQKGKVHWTDLSLYQAFDRTGLLPTDGTNTFLPDPAALTPVCTAPSAGIPAGVQTCTEVRFVPPIDGIAGQVISSGPTAGSQ